MRLRGGGRGGGGGDAERGTKNSCDAKNSSLVARALARW
jgi:hypothetical protein